jgi:hypothetical protein
VDELLTDSLKYGIELDRNSRKQLRLMRHAGQLPSLDVLLAASRLYKVRIFVYFWSDQPVIYQFDNYPNVIHIQCISGVHFNPLIEMRGYEMPESNECEVNSVHFACTNSQAGKTGHPVFSESEPDDELTKALLTVDTSSKMCKHPVSSLPQVWVSVGLHNLCAVLDSGAEISLVSVSTVQLFQTSGAQCVIGND